MPSVLGITCFFLCLSFNLTFPMHRNSRWISFENSRPTHSQVCKNQFADKYPLTHRTKKMVANIESIMKKIKDSSQDIGNNIQFHTNLDDKHESKTKLNDLNHYEQLVFMKKYPYLDIKEFEMKYRPGSNKIARESVELESGTNLRGDSSLCEPLEEGLNVEVINRGLSGFNIPPRNTNGAEVVSNEKSKQEAILKIQPF